MTPARDVTGTRQRLRVWWLVWAGTLGVLGVVYLAVTRGPVRAPELPPEQSLTGLAGVVPLFISILIRWLVLPRYRSPGRAFVLFVAGVALAEACGLLGIFLGGPYRQDLFVLGLMGIAQFVPFFAKGLYEPKASGFVPNN